MVENFHMWWAKISRKIKVILVLFVLVIVVGAFGYILRWETGFNKKTLWDWMQLLIIPVFLVIGGFLLTQLRDRNDSRIALDQLQATVLQDYLFRMSELLLDKDLRHSEVDAEVRHVARSLTLATLRRLNGSRKGDVLKFLYEAELIKGDNRIIDLLDADLSEVALYRDVRAFISYNLSEVNLSGANLEGAWLGISNLSRANLSRTSLARASIEGANLSGANLSGAALLDVDLHGANLSGANLSWTDITIVNLKGAKLDGVIIDGMTYLVNSKATLELLQEMVEFGNKKMKIYQQELKKQLKLSLKR